MASHSHRSRSPTAPCPSWGHAHAPRCRRRLVRALLLVAALALAAAGGGGRGSAAAAAAATQQRIPAIFMFGDSIVDPGNNNNRLTEAKANFPPYGQDFPGGVATGRFSNGLVPGDLLASKLGIKELLPPFIGTDLQLEDLLTGVAFACGGSGYDPLTSKLATTLSSADQLQLFQDYKDKLAALAVYFTVMGANDIVNNYFILPIRRHQYDLSSYVDFLVSSAINFTRTLNDMGAQRIAFLGVPPLGCCPSQITLAGSPSRQCDPARNQASELYNSRVSKEIERLNAERSGSGSKFVYVDIYYNLLDLIQNPASFQGRERGLLRQHGAERRHLHRVPQRVPQRARLHILGRIPPHAEGIRHRGGQAHPAELQVPDDVKTDTCCCMARGLYLSPYKHTA
uniref:GDSL esterase/lipase EXL3 n=1 Tax=Zea mays TaxID=4577 RepID=A0A804Q6I9_MAIZE